MQVVATDLQFPEGPVWLDDGSVLVVEIRRRTLTRIWPRARKEIVAELGGGPNGAALGPDGACYVCNNGGFRFAERNGKWVITGQADDYSGGRIERVDLATGRVERLYDRVGDEPIRGANDLVFDAHGGFYFTDPGKVRARELDRGKVCYATADGRSIREVIFPIHKPNGIGLSPTAAALRRRDRERPLVELAGHGTGRARARHRYDAVAAWRDAGVHAVALPALRFAGGRGGRSGVRRDARRRLRDRDRSGDARGRGGCGAAGHAHHQPVLRWRGPAHRVDHVLVCGRAGAGALAATGLARAYASSATASPQGDMISVQPMFCAVAQHARRHAKA